MSVFFWISETSLSRGLAFCLAELPRGMDSVAERIVAHAKADLFAFRVSIY